MGFVGIYRASISCIVSLRQSTWNDSALCGWIFMTFYIATNSDVDHIQTGL